MRLKVIKSFLFILKAPEILIICAKDVAQSKISNNAKKNHTVFNEIRPTTVAVKNLVLLLQPLATSEWLKKKWLDGNDEHTEALICKLSLIRRRKVSSCQRWESNKKQMRTRMRKIMRMQYLRTPKHLCD